MLKALCTKTTLAFLLGITPMLSVYAHTYQVVEVRTIPEVDSIETFIDCNSQLDSLEFISVNLKNKVDVRSNKSKENKEKEKSLVLLTENEDGISDSFQIISPSIPYTRFLFLFKHTIISNPVSGTYFTNSKPKKNRFYLKIAFKI